MIVMKFGGTSVADVAAIERLIAIVRAARQVTIQPEAADWRGPIVVVSALGGATDRLFEDATNTFERNFILRALEKCGWNVTGTSEYLGIPLSTLKYKMDKLEVRQIAKRLRGA